MSENELQVKEETKAVAVSDATTMLQAIGQMAVNPDVDIDKVERLMAMQERLQAKENEDAFNRAMSAVQSEMHTVAENKLNQQTGSTYSDLAAIINMIKPIYTSHGMSLSFGVEPSEDTSIVRIVCYVSACGHTRTYYYDSPITDKGLKGNTVMTGQHARGSAMSYGRRYLTRLIFNIPTGDDDDGNAYLSNIEYITPEQEADLVALAQEVGADMGAFLKVLKVGELGLLPANKYQGAVMRLEERRKAHA